MPAGLVHQRCFNHADREAVARCPECGRFFCRECITEHADRVVCAPCLERLAARREERRRRLGVVWRACQGLAAFVAIWLCFYVLGLGLILIPSEFHETGVWHVGVWEDR